MERRLAAILVADVAGYPAVCGPKTHSRRKSVSRQNPGWQLRHTSSSHHLYDDQHDQYDDAGYKEIFFDHDMPPAFAVAAWALVLMCLPHPFIDFPERNPS